MTRNTVFKLARSAGRHLSTRNATVTRSSLLHQPRVSLLSQAPRIVSIQAHRRFSTTPATSRGLSPDSEDPQPKRADVSGSPVQPAEITIEEYHELSDAFMDTMVEKMEQLQEERDDVDVEYSVGSQISIHPLSALWTLS
jgi:frataxin